MNNQLISNTLRFVVLILLQVLILNNMNLFGYINPYIYIVFVFYYPIKKELSVFLIFSFLIGLCIDIFSNTGGINASATLLIAFLRLPILSKILNKTDFDYQSFNIRLMPFGKSFVYIFTLTFIHHLTVFSLDYFSFNDIISILNKTFFTTIFTVTLILSSIIIFTKRQ